MRNQAKFDLVTLRAPKEDPEVGGDYYGLPWPCWGKPELRHPGTANLYDTSLHVMDGGSTFRARFGVERDGETLHAEGSYTKGTELTDGEPEFQLAAIGRAACRARERKFGRRSVDDGRIKTQQREQNKKIRHEET